MIDVLHERTGKVRFFLVKELPLLVVSGLSTVCTFALHFTLSKEHANQALEFFKLLFLLRSQLRSISAQ